MAKRTSKNARLTKPRSIPEPKPSWPADRHSGEGSASALAILQNMERRRVVPRPAEPAPPDDPAI